LITFALNQIDMKELVFIVEESQDGGYYAKAVDHSIVTQGETLPELKSKIGDAVRCHFDEGELPKLIHLHVTREETYSL
jgi:predicted RNase H-like HicB family nuclease